MNSATQRAGSSGQDTSSLDAAVDAALQGADADAMLRQIDAQTNLDEVNSLRDGMGVESAHDTDPAGTQGPNGTPSSRTGEKQAGRDVVLRYLESHANDLPGGAETFRDLQRQNSRLGNDRAEQGSELTDLRETVARLQGLVEGRGESTEAAAPEVNEVDQKRQQVLARLRPAQREVFQALVDEMGLVSRESMEAEAAERRSEEFTATTITEGINQFGDDFGTMEGDSFVWNPEIKPEVEKAFSRLTSETEGITPTDLYWIVRGPKLVAGGGGGLNQNWHDRDAVQRRLRAGTIEGSASQTGAQSGLYNKASGDTLADVTSRALLESVRGQ